MNTKEILKEIYNNPLILSKLLGYPDLTEIHSEWIKKSWKSKDKTYVIQAHRGSYKTTSLLVIGIIWRLLFNPNDTILIVRKTIEGSKSILQELLKHYQGEYLKSFYESIYNKPFNLVKANTSQIELPFRTSVSKESNIETIGIGGSITGRHYDFIICDDISTLEDRISKAEREYTKTFIKELYNIRKPEGKLIFSGTPWHKEDIFSILPSPDKYPLGSIQVKGITPEVVEEIRSSTSPSLFSANYLLEHITDEERVFQEIQWIDKLSELNYGFLDVAYGGKDYNSLSIGSYSEGKYIMKGYMWKESIVDLYPVISRTCKDNHVKTLYIDGTGDKGLSALEMKKHFPSVVNRIERENKNNKILHYLKRNWNNVYFTKDSNTEYLSQIIEYSDVKNNVNDDSPDSVSSLIRELEKNKNPLLLEISLGEK